MWGNTEPVLCVYCKKEITGCCYPAYHGTTKIGYRHIMCYELQSEKPFGEVTNQNGEELD